MSKIRVNSIGVKNYRSFGNEPQRFTFPEESYRKPVAIVGYNNSGKTNLMNAIRYGLNKRVTEETFELKDFHNCRRENPPEFMLSFVADIVDREMRAGTSYTNDSRITVGRDGVIDAIDTCDCYQNPGSNRNKKAVINQKAPIFYINFHKIKDEISTQKSNWGSLKSFLAKHIKKVVDADGVMKDKKEDFKSAIKNATDEVLKGSALSSFIEAIQKNYTSNLRGNNCEIDFGLPDYEDIFLQMMFKVGLHGERDNLVPIDHFGDGYISMFVMAVIKAIAETNTDDRCLFLFEEPESFLHENHQEYFYKAVLCSLSEKGHQVIYTTHSDRMVDAFDTEGLIRLEFDEEKKQTVKKYNRVDQKIEVEDLRLNEQEKVISLASFNSFIKSVEPNLNKILFSKKVVLVEGPNDLMVYREGIKRKVRDIVEERSDIENKDKYADTYLNFHNIAILPHHGKVTALFLAKLCGHIGLDYYIINDWDLEEGFVEELKQFDTEEAMKESAKYTSTSSDKKATITTNWKLISTAKNQQIHFNMPKLEVVIGYTPNDKSSIGIWKRLEEMEADDFGDKLFPKSLEDFLEFPKEQKRGNRVAPEKHTVPVSAFSQDDDFPF